MPLSQELIDAYALSARPYVEADGPITAGVLNLRSWRYLIELNTACNLRCVMCTCGNSQGYDRPKGNQIMELDLLEKVLAKIKSENPSPIVCPYGNGEPFLYPHLPEAIKAINRYGFRSELATNLHYTTRLDEVLEAQPGFMIVSVSGFTQEMYGKSHIGGDIEKVKQNLKLLAERNSQLKNPVAIAVSYHMYNDNLGEVELMDKFVKELGFMFMLSWARTISLENTVQALRFLDERKGESVAPYPEVPEGKDWNILLPPAKYAYIENMERLRFHPGRARSLYAKWPVAPVCLIGDVFTYIRHDASVQLCAWVDDRRMILGNYLDMTQEQISEARRGHGFCKECLKYRMNLYYHVADCTKWDGGGYV